MLTTEHLLLKHRNSSKSDLAKVQKRRELPTKFIQFFQSQIQKRIVAQALDKSKSFKLPFFLHLPFIKNIPPRIVAFGLWKVNVED